MLEILHFRITLQSTQCGFVEPAAQKDSPIGRSETVLLPLGEVVIIIHPLIHLLAQIDLHVPPKPTVDWLHLVSLVGRQLVVIYAPLLEELDVVWLLLRVQVVLEQQVACGRRSDACLALRLNEGLDDVLDPLL